VEGGGWLRWGRGAKRRPRVSCSWDTWGALPEHSPRRHKAILTQGIKLLGLLACSRLIVELSIEAGGFGLESVTHPFDRGEEESSHGFRPVVHRGEFGRRI
jgi:hypothetical protein